jgi:hypothetical protein
MNLQTFLSTFLTAVQAARHLLHHVQLNSRDLIGKALRHILEAHEAIPVWSLPEQYRPTNIAFDYMKLLDTLDLSHRGAGFVRCDMRLGSGEEHLRSIILGLAQSDEAAWRIALDDGLLLYQQSPLIYANATTALASPEEIDRIKGELRQSYLSSGGSPEKVAEMPEIGFDFIDRMLMSCASALARVCQSLLLGDPTNVIVPASRFESIATTTAASLAKIAQLG